MSKQHVKYGPAADRLGCRISIKMASHCHSPVVAQFSQQTGTMCVFTATQYRELVLKYCFSLVIALTSLGIFFKIIDELVYLKFNSWAKPCILWQCLYTGTKPVNKDFGTCIWVQRCTKIV